MTYIQLLLIFLVLVAGTIILVRVHFLQKQETAEYSKEAINKLEHDLYQIMPEIDNYTIYRCIKKFGGHDEWVESNYQEMKALIRRGASFNSSGEPMHIVGPSLYSLHISMDAKRIYYVTGDDSYDFKEIEEKHGLESNYF